MAQPMYRRGQGIRKPSIDVELIHRIQGGDKEAFNVLVLKYQNKISKLVSRHVRNPNEISDITQEVFIKAYRALDKFRAESTFYTWLYRIAVNTAKNYTLEQGRRPPDNDIDVFDAENYAGPSKLKEYATPEHELLCDEIENTVNHVFQSLPEELRTAIMLREIEGMSYDDIAQQMSCPVGTVRSRIFRAREAIDARVKPLLKR